MMKFRRCAEQTLLAGVLVVGLLGATARTAHAQSEKASAEALFADGRRLMGEGKAEQACGKFAASNKLDPSSGTLLNLGNCYEKLGRNASAWAAYAEAASRAQSAGREDHLRIAQKHVTSLEPLLAHVTVTVPTPVEGLEITRDGFAVASAEWGLAVPIDPGTHAYTAKAPGYEPWSGKLDVTVDPASEAPPQAAIAIPALKKLPPAPVVKGPGAVVEPPFWTTQRTLAVAAGAVGVVGLGVGGVFGLSAKTSYNDSLAFCPKNKNLCTQPGVDARDDARSKGNIASVAVIAGGALVATGAVLWFTAPSEKNRTKGSLGISPTVGSAMTGLHVQGAW
jgi:hypothetical protein